MIAAGFWPPPPNRLGSLMHASLRVVSAPARSALLVALLAAASLPGVARADTLFEILPGSTYSYLVGGFSPVPDCDGNDDLQCDFEITGTFEFDGQAITAADLTLISPLPVDPILPTQLTTADSVEDFLEGLTWALLPPFPPTVVYEATNLPGGGSLNLAFTPTSLGGGPGALSGGYDLRAVDGDGVQFNALLRVIPEPGAGVMSLLALASTAARRR